MWAECSTTPKHSTRHGVQNHGSDLESIRMISLAQIMLSRFVVYQVASITLLKILKGVNPFFVQRALKVSTQIKQGFLKHARTVPEAGTKVTQVLSTVSPV